MYGEIKQTKCGENRFVSKKNWLEFYLQAGCELQIAPRDAIQTDVRMEWTMDQFFAKGGPTAFVDRLCASLGIHASTVKVVSVYKGSVGVVYEITPSKEEPLSLEQIKSKQTQKFATGAMDLGAPVLDVAQGDEKVVSDGVTVAAGFPAKVLVKTSTNQGSVVWEEWIKPWLWEAYAWCLIESPGMIFYNFNSLGLTWLWNELAIEVRALAEADGVHGEGGPLVAPTEGHSNLDGGGEGLGLGGDSVV